MPCGNKSDDMAGDGLKAVLQVAEGVVLAEDVLAEGGEWVLVEHIAKDAARRADAHCKQDVVLGNNVYSAIEEQSLAAGGLMEIAKLREYPIEEEKPAVHESGIASCVAATGQGRPANAHCKEAVVLCKNPLEPEDLMASFRLFIADSDVGCHVVQPLQPEGRFAILIAIVSFLLAMVTYCCANVTNHLSHVLWKIAHPFFAGKDARPSTINLTELCKLSMSYPSEDTADKEMMLKRLDGLQVKQMPPLCCDRDPTWCRKVLERCALMLEELTLRNPRREHMCVVFSMPRLKKLHVAANDGALDANPPVMGVLPPGHVGLRLLSARLPRATLESLLRANARTLHTLQLPVDTAAGKEWASVCSDLVALLQHCVFGESGALKRLHLRWIGGCSTSCVYRLPALRRALARPLLKILCSGCYLAKPEAMRDEAWTPMWGRNQSTWGSNQLPPRGLPKVERNNKPQIGTQMALRAEWAKFASIPLYPNPVQMALRDEWAKYASIPLYPNPVRLENRYEPLENCSKPNVENRCVEKRCVALRCKPNRCKPSFEKWCEAYTYEDMQFIHNKPSVHSLLCGCGSVCL